MGTRIEKSIQVKEPVEVVWRFLTDIKKVVTCVPGAQITEQLAEDRFKGSVSVKVGPAVTDFKGEVQVLRVDPQIHEIEILGKGQDVRGKGGASMKMTGSLVAAADGGTEVKSVSEVNIVGLLAQMGSRMINEVSNIMFEKFTKNFQEKLEQEVKQGSPEEATGIGPKPINAVSVAFSAIKAAMKRNKTGSEAGDSKADKEATTEEEPERKVQ